MNKVLVIMFFH